MDRIISATEYSDLVKELYKKTQCLSDADQKIVYDMVDRLSAICEPTKVLEIAHESATNKGTDTMSEEEVVERVSRIRRELRSEDGDGH